jgi:hypothetical protein
MTNINEAKEKYEGKRFLFEGLEVDRVENSDKSIMVGNVKLKPRYEIDLDQIFPGFIIDVAGVPQSLFLDRILIVNDCWVFIVEGGEYELPPFY